MTDSVVELLARQLAAYNARDLEGFVACYAPGVILLDGDGNVVAEGKDGLRHLYAGLFESSPNLHCEVVQRVRVGRFVIDEERLTGVQFEGLPGEFRAAQVYRFDEENLIDRVTAIVET